MPEILTSFEWLCEACGWEQDADVPLNPPRAQSLGDWPEVVRCERCGIQHRVEYDYDPSEGPNIQVFMLEGEESMTLTMFADGHLQPDRHPETLQEAKDIVRGWLAAGARDVSAEVVNAAGEVVLEYDHAGWRSDLEVP